MKNEFIILHGTLFGTLETNNIDEVLHWSNIGHIKRGEYLAVSLNFLIKILRLDYEEGEKSFCSNIRS